MLNAIKYRKVLKTDNYKYTFKLALLGVTSLLLLTPSAKAIELNSSQVAPANNLNNRPILLAQRTCPSNESIPDRRFDTANFYVYICSGDEENSLGYYVGIAKSGSGSITLPLTRRSGDTYVATNGDTTYAVTPSQLVVTRNRRVVLRERVIDATDGEGQPLASGCPDGQSTFVEAETKNFVVYICGGDLPGSYVGIAKNGSGRINLALQSYNPRGGPEASRFVAVNNNTRYILTRNRLTVTQGGRTIVNEKVLRWN